jgi:transketolase
MSNALEFRAVEMGKNVVRMTTAAGSGHPSSGLALVHLVASLMYRQMRHDPANPWHPGSDRLVLSEGHAVPVVYAAYADLGGAVGKSPAEKRTLTIDDLRTLREQDSVLDGHPNPAEGFPFFDAATGSLGQGLSVGAGLGLAARLNKLDKRIFVIIGDGESREGQIWEALDFIIDHKLTHVCPIFNCNGQGQADYVSRQQSPEVLAAKLQAFGYLVEVIDGHDLQQIATAVDKVGQTAQPMAVIAKTQKGWGVDSLKDKSNHGKPLPEADVAAAIACLFNAGAYDNQYVPKILRYCHQNLDNLGNQGYGHWHYAHYYYAQVLYREGGKEWETYRDKMFPRLVSEAGPDGSWNQGYIGTVYTTASNLTILLLPRNALPIYQR